MRALRLLAAALLMSGSLVVVGSAPAWACSCVRGLDGSEDAYFLRTADVAFTGTLVDRREPGSLFGGGSSNDPVTLVFAVDRVLKGQAHRTQELRTARSGASCGLELPVGRPVLVFADQEGGGLTANLCGGSREIKADEARGSRVPLTGREPAPPRRPLAGRGAVPDQGPSLLLLALGGAAAALGAAGAYVAVRRRR